MTPIKGKTRGKNGYVKLCASWLRTFWSPDTAYDSTDFESLNKPTIIFDQCGIYDKTEDSNGIPYGSDHPEF
jgi:hypothetical protein